MDRERYLIFFILLPLHKKWSFYEKFDQIRFLQEVADLWHLLKKSLMENLIFCALYIAIPKKKKKKNAMKASSMPL